MGCGSFVVAVPRGFFGVGATSWSIFIYNSVLIGGIGGKVSFEGFEGCGVRIWTCVFGTCI